MSSGKADSNKLKELREQEQAAKKPLQDVVVQSGLLADKELTQLYAKEIEAPFIEVNTKELKREILKTIPERVARQYNVVLFDITQDGTKLLAMEDPDDIQAVNFLKKQLGDNIKVHVATRANLQAALDQYKGNIGSELTKVVTAEDEEEASEPENEVSAEDLAEDSPIAQTVNLLIEYAIRGSASDIHIEPRENYTSVRYRIDGVLREANKLPKKIHNAVVSRIKILSNLKIDERRLPQDGRFKIQIGSVVFALRVSTLPIAEGEKVVMRLLSESNKPPTLEELGYWGYSKTAIDQAITQPHGMVLVTGPTGSGKSTSLFSILSLLNKPSVNISTVEDPVEYKIQGANQTQINPKAGLTFATGLRSLLRQDPNIIMVGEIRDTETAELGVQAALTGHLVFATLHTNNAATCLPRLLDMRVEPFLIASTVRAVVGQRLVRRLCVDCRQEATPDQAVLKQIDDTFHTGQSEVMTRIHNLETQAMEYNLGKEITGKAKVDTSKPSTTESKITKLYKTSPDGCETCSHTGYKGRMGIYEVLLNSTAVQQLVVTRNTSEALQNQGVKEGMITMQIDGLIKALRGITTIEEILRVTTAD